MATNKRPYFVIFNGKERMVEATSPAMAVRHIVGAAVTELRTARGSEVSAWMRGGKEMEDATIKAAPAAAIDEATMPEVGKAGTLIPAVPQYTHCDVPDWIDKMLGIKPGDVLAIDGPCARAQDIAATVVASGLTLEQFDELRVIVPAFAEALSLYSHLGRASVDELRSYLEQKPMTLDEIERALASFNQDGTHWTDPKTAAE
jgi:hypothetical protein